MNIKEALWKARTCGAEQKRKTGRASGGGCWQRFPRTSAPTVVGLQVTVI